MTTHPCDYNTGPGSDQCPHGYFWPGPQAARMTGTHVPACASVDEHVANAVRESAGIPEALDAFVARVRADWQDEQLIADMGDAAVREHWANVERDFHMAMAL
jgi:hypothetical protein